MRLLDIKTIQVSLLLKRQGVNQVFIFCVISFNDICKEIKGYSLYIYKEIRAAQSTDIPVKILMQNSDMFSTYICDFFL